MTCNSELSVEHCERYDSKITYKVAVQKANQAVSTASINFLFKYNVDTNDELQSAAKKATFA